ncbi:MAG: OmpA family protein [Cellvibrionaceae bacterium]|nr:OmpA family protein [Cellvibrionaceae bacterium]
MYQRSTKTRRYIIRAEKPRAGLLPLALLGLLFIILPLLYLLFSYAKNNIEANTRSSVKQALLNAGLGWIAVDTDGQFVSLTGSGDSGEASRALALAEASEADTWLGRLTAPISVDIDIEQVAPLDTATNKDIKAPPPADQATGQLKWGNTTNTLDDGLLTLEGEVGDPREKSALIQNARTALYFPEVDRLNHQLTVKPRSVKGSLELAMLATSLLSQCQSGQSETSEGVLSLDCRATSEAASAIASLKSQPLIAGSFGAFNVDIIADCGTGLRAALATTNYVHFRVNSNELPASSNALFDDLAELMRNCPRLLRIDGHTDDNGDHEFNMNLSFRRAMAGVEALVTRGVDREFVVPYAYGPNQPRSIEATPAAKASNRRIEIHLFNQGDN